MENRIAFAQVRSAIISNEISGSGDLLSIAVEVAPRVSRVVGE